MSSAKPGSFRMSDGDWICEDQSCQNINFARRVNCNLCGKDKPIDSRLKDKEDDSKRKAGHEIGKAAADKSKGLFSADDWQCGRCGNVNWARRSTCNMCSAPKFGDNEERTGLGGGYNEREEVEYVDRRPTDSDDEWDDFGRKKKRLKSDDNKSDPDLRNHSDDNSNDNKDIESSHHKTKDISEDEDEEEDDADVSKYKLESDEEEEEDDDEDLSKYDLSDCLENKK